MAGAPLTTVAPDTGNKERLRLWIRLLRATHVVEAELRDRLKREFDTTLPRFDVMAALYRERGGMLMSDLSRYLLVSNGNVTGIVDRLVSEGLIVRAQREGDRRTSIVRLTDAGVAQFERMAAAHEGWIAELLAGVDEGHVRHLSGMLRAFRSEWELEH
ncbi:MAG: MarR family transcriptional regulator [Rhizobiaceae bacterium]|nr:MarR family transcriptional regulator [Rhizobiaceae bacterium]